VTIVSTTARVVFAVVAVVIAVVGPAERSVAQGAVEVANDPAPEPDEEGQVPVAPARNEARDWTPDEPSASPGPENDDEPAVLVDIEFDGATYFKKETLATFVRSTVNDFVDEEQLRADARAIADQYRARGFLQAEVAVSLFDVIADDADDVQHTPAVAARFLLRPGDRAELKAVHVVGNTRVSEAALQEGFFSRPPEPLGVLTRAGLFHRPYLEQDQQRLLLNYYRHGFLEARVLETRVVAASDLSGIDVTLAVAEGPRYQLAELTFTGDLPDGVTSSSWRSRIGLVDGGVADLVALQQAAEPLLDAWREQGFPFAHFEQQLALAPVRQTVPAKPSTTADAAGDKAIAVTMRAVRGPLARVRSVRIVGQRGTMEHVLRREVVVVPGDRFDQRTVRLTERQLMQTGILASALGRAVPVAASPGTTESPAEDDRGEETFVDVEFTVAETTTWLLSPSGFGDANEGFVFVGVVGDRNLLGTGLQTFGSLQASRLRFLFDVSLTEPRLLGTRSSATVELHRRQLRYRGFSTLSQGGGSIRASYAHELGYRLGGPARLFLGGGGGIEFGGVLMDEERPFAPSSLFPQDTFRNVVEVRGGFDTREGGLSPRNGVLAMVEGRTAGPWTGSGLAFIDGQANLRVFWSPIFDVTLKSNSQVGAVVQPFKGLVPVTDRYFLGGLGSMRGFFPRSIGPSIDAALRDGGTSAVEAGGVVKVVQNVEVEAPVWPGLPLRAFGFVDAGNAFGEDELDRGLVNIARGTTALPLNLLWSTGFGFLIETPVLPFRFEWSVPLTRRSFDPPLNFFLGVGSAF
jgi:outer membrane protein insertion porin family